MPPLFLRSLIATLANRKNHYVQLSVDFTFLGLAGQALQPWQWWALLLGRRGLYFHCFFDHLPHRLANFRYRFRLGPHYPFCKLLMVDRGGLLKTEESYCALLNQNLDVPHHVVVWLAVRLVCRIRLAGLHCQFDLSILNRLFQTSL